MKEYIAKVNGEYRLIDDNEVVSGRIEVPSGAEEALYFGRGVIEFYKDNRTNFFDKVDKRWEKCRGDHSERTVAWQRSPSREYINKTTGEYRKTNEVVSGEQWVEIPNPDCIFAVIDGSGSITFSSIVKSLSYLMSSLTNARLLWTRAAQPEALPFVDDDFIVKDNKALFDKIRSGAIQVKFVDDEPSLNDQYAEIEQVRQSTVSDTLAARQATYGSFEDVAFVTEGIMDLIARVRPNGLKDIPIPHRMSLYMIASKIARLANGDIGHKDSWHDIGGYAKLIEDLID